MRRVIHAGDPKVFISILNEHAAEPIRRRQTPIEEAIASGPPLRPLGDLFGIEILRDPSLKPNEWRWSWR